MRFGPLDSWPDNGNLDKARRLLWPIKQKYGKRLSWGDLMILAGNVGLEDMGFKAFGFAGGRADAWEGEEAYFGTPESFKGLARDPSRLEQPLAASVMSLIYVNPEGPDGIPDPLLAAGHIRETFARMAMDDEETVALIAGGHTFGKAHGAAPGSKCGPPPGDAPIEAQGLGWLSSHGKGKAEDSITSGLEGAWTADPAKWDHGYFHNLFRYDWELHQGPGGAHQWRPKHGAGAATVPDAHVPGKTHPPMMLTTDLSLIRDPEYLRISKKYYADPELFADAFARAWYKLTHRDMGPVERCLGPEVAPAQIWQDPVPAGRVLADGEVAALRGRIARLGLPPGALLRAAWASAATFRRTDFRGGANGARVALAPQRDWEANNPAELAAVLERLRAVRGVASLADAIVLAGNVGVEMAAAAAGRTVAVPFASGRGDATAEDTDAASFAVLEPRHDGFRNFRADAYQLVDRAHLLALSAPEMAALVAGLRVTGGNALAAGALGVLTDRPGTLTNDYFVHLLDANVRWEQRGTNLFEGVDCASGVTRWKASSADLCFGSNAELRAIAEYYAGSDAGDIFVNDFVNAWTKVMNLSNHPVQSQGRTKQHTAAQSRL